MRVELKKEDILNLLKGTTPSYELMENEIIKKCGNFTGGFDNKWYWNNKSL